MPKGTSWAEWGIVIQTNCSAEVKWPYRTTKEKLAKQCFDIFRLKLSLTYELPKQILNNQLQLAGSEAYEWPSDKPRTQHTKRVLK